MKIGKVSLVFLELFVTGGFLGWIIDTTYRSIKDQAFSHAGYLEALTGLPIPFLPVYGFGLIIIFIVRENMKRKNEIAKAALYGISLTALELMAGIFTLLTLNISLWDYSQNSIHFLGIIDGAHAFYWLILALAVDMVIQRAEDKKIIYPLVLR